MEILLTWRYAHFPIYHYFRNFTGDLSGDVKNTEVDRRAGFVDSLLKIDVSEAVVSVDSSNTSVDSQTSHAQEDKSYRDVGTDMNAESTF